MLKKDSSGVLCDVCRRNTAVAVKNELPICAQCMEEAEGMGTHDAGGLAKTASAFASHDKVESED